MKRFILAALLIPCIALAQMPVETDDNVAIHKGEMYTAEYSASGVLSAGVYLVGITTGSRQILVLDRSYSSTESSLRVELFENSYTGGSAANRYNRNFIIGGTGPLTVMTGVTATLGTPITTANFSATSSAGNIQLPITGDPQRFILKPNTSYVVRFTNTGATTATISSKFFYRAE